MTQHNVLGKTDNAKPVRAFSGAARTARRVIASCLVAGGLAGCGGIDGIEFQGALFEMAGLTEIGKKRGDRQMEPRAPLVVPPSKKLVQPGSEERPIVAGQESWPVDPDQRKVVLARQAEEERKRKCRDGVFAKNTKVTADDYKQLHEGQDGCDSILRKIINKPIAQPNQ